MREFAEFAVLAVMGLCCMAVPASIVRDRMLAADAREAASYDDGQEFAPAYIPARRQGGAA